MPLRLYLLGPPQIHWDDRRFNIPRRQARALLYRLATRMELAPRETICFLFWSDIPEHNARRNLSRVLSLLRTALPHPDMLISDGEDISLDRRRIWSDTIAFERCYREGNVAGEVSSLDQAILLYRGSFLSGFALPESPEYEAWMLGEQRYWEQRYLTALSALVEQCTQRQQLDRAIDLAQRYLVMDAMSEQMHRNLMTLYAARGDRQAAMRQYEACVATLERELGVRPLPETRSVYLTVLGRETIVDREVPSDRAWVTPPGLQLPMVGRNGVLEEMREAFTRARQGDGGLVLISGQAGIGKTRLMQEFASSLPDPALVLMAVSQKGNLDLPYHPVVQALRSAGDLSDVLHRVPVIWLAEAARLLPDLGTARPDLPPPLPVQPEEARTRLFEALCHLALGMISDDGVLILCMDNLQWSDGATLAWLTYVADCARSKPVLLVGAYRSEESSRLAEFRRSLARQTDLLELHLEGIDAASIQELLHACGRHLSARPGLAERLHDATGGNPFFLLETLRSMLESSDLDQEPEKQLLLPLNQTVQRAVAARLSRLRPIARQIIEAGAVLGAAFGFDILRATAGRREMETMDGLDELVARQLFIEQDTHYRFQHDLVRRAVEANLSPMRRQLLHRRAGRALERLDLGTPGSLAHHFAIGGRPKKALQYHDLAATAASGLFAWEKAEGHLGQMLSALDILDPDCSDVHYCSLRGDVFSRRANLRYLRGKRSQRDADLLALVQLARRAGNDPLLLQSSVDQVRYLNLDGRYVDAIAAAQEGLAVAVSLEDSKASSRLHAQMGFAHLLLGQPEQALASLETAETALAALGDSPDQAARGRILRVRGHVYFHLSSFEMAVECHEEALHIQREQGAADRIALAQLDLGLGLLKLNRFREFDRHVADGMALARRIGARPVEAHGLCIQGFGLLYRAEFREAVRSFEHSLAIHRSLPSRHEVSAALLGLGFAFYRQGSLAKAKGSMNAALETAQAVRHDRGISRALAGLGLVSTAQGALEDAVDLLCRGLAVAEACRCPENIALLLTALSAANRLGGDLENAREHAYEGIEVAEQFALPSEAMWARIEAGLTHLDLGEREEALVQVNKAMALLPDAHQAWVSHSTVRDLFDRLNQPKPG
ncbi:MAG: AAA family ATPase [Chloroflexota bacterium]|nr:AAA family ATPase [Chloroflexota bacterium]